MTTPMITHASPIVAMTGLLNVGASVTAVGDVSGMGTSLHTHTHFDAPDNVNVGPPI